MIFMIHIPPDTSPVVSIMEEPVGNSHDLPDPHTACPVLGGLYHEEPPEG
jgi:hypothetical protein